MKIALVRTALFTIGGLLALGMSAERGAGPIERLAASGERLPKGGKARGARNDGVPSVDPATLKFSHPRDITHPYLPLSSLRQDVLEGREDGKLARLERTVKPDLRRAFRIGGQRVEALAVEDRSYLDGKLKEVAIDYFAQDDLGTVYYLGETVDAYEDGKVVNHEGAWLVGVDTLKLGVILPAHPAVGDRFLCEDVSPKIREVDEVLAIDETVTVPAGTFPHCLKVKENLADGTVEYAYYAPGIGVIREVPEDGDLKLVSHTASP